MGGFCSRERIFEHCVKMWFQKVQNESEENAISTQIRIQIEKIAMALEESFPFYGVFYDASTYGEKGKVLNLLSW